MWKGKFHFGHKNCIKASFTRGRPVDKMKKWNIFFVGVVLGSLTESQIRRKLYDYQTLSGVNDTVITDLLRMVFITVGRCHVCRDVVQGPNLYDMGHI